MTTHVVDIRQFYQSRLGRVAARTITERIRKLWPDIHNGATVVGLGYAVPFMPADQHNGPRYFAAMPADQGVIRWPRKGPNRTVLTENHLLPFDDQSVDYLIMTHIVENSEVLNALMKDVWRVLKGSGRLIVIVPNRTGAWARFDSTPFGHGKPYSTGQLRDLLKAAKFVPHISKGALYFPPFDKRFILSSARGFEWMGKHVFPQLAGLNIVEASKQLYALHPPREGVKAKTKKSIQTAVSGA